MDQFDHNLRLLSPVWLGALLLLPLVVIAVRGSLARESTWRRLATITLRSAVLALLVLALCSPAVDRRNHASWAVLLVDRSDSIAGATVQAKSFVDETLAKTNSDHLLVVPFAVQPGSPATGAWLESQPSDTTSTNIAAAFAEVAELPRPFGPARVVLLSDGNANAGEKLLPAALALQGPVDVVPLTPQTGPDAWVAAIDAPSEVRPGCTFPVKVTIGSTADGEARVRVTRQNQEIAHQDMVLSPGQRDVSFELDLGSGPRDLYRVTLDSALNSPHDNNWAEFAVWHGSPARALLVGADRTRFLRWSRILQREQFEAETIPAERFPRNQDQLSPYDLVVLANIPAKAFDAGQLDAIERHVRDKAGGLIVFGGQDSLTAGDYQGTALERVLPVTCEFDVQAKRPSLAMVLVIDQSGSMEEAGAIDLAKTALRQTVQMLDAQDELGVIAFQDIPHWIVPLQPCDDKEKVFREIDTLEAGGGTNMLPAIAKAHLALHDAFADLKHIIVLTDGISYPGDFDTLASEIAASGITISTVAVGTEAAEPLLQSIAELGGGNYHHCTSAAEVPGIFVRETAKAARMGIREEPFFPQTKSALTSVATLPGEKTPALLGYVQTKAKPGAEVGIVSDSGDPLLAWWQLGRGHVAAFTSDLRGPWTRPWQDWAGLEPLWTALAKQTVRPANLDGYQLRCRRQGDRTRVALDAIPYPGHFDNDAQVAIDILAPSGTKHHTEMPLVAPGQYAVDVATPESGVYDFLATCTLAEGATFEQRCSASPTYPAEWTPLATNQTRLQDVVESTGGQFDPPARDLLAAPEELRSCETWWLSHYLLLAAIVLLLAELALRRLAPRSERM